MERCISARLISLLGALAFFLLLLAGSGGSAFAQGGNGSISGHVTDSSGALLKGAQIRVDPGAISAVSDAQGDFLVPGLAPGAYTVTISYVGFATSTNPTNVTASQVATVDAELTVASETLQVLVTAGRASGEAEEVNRERSADNIVQVLTSDVIRSLPNANMADALGRLPSVTIERDEGEGKYVQIRGTEPGLSNVTVDGVNVPSPESGVRQIKLDAVPSDLVESVEINKTLQANMDGDGIGGSVNLVTKTAGERPTVSISGIGGYTPILPGRGLTEETATLGQRFGAQKRLGILLGGSYDWNGRGIDDVEPVSDINQAANNARTFEAQDIREYKYYRTRWGLAGSSDYKISESSNLYLRGLYSNFRNFGSRWVYSLNDNTQGEQLGGSNGCQTNPSGVTVAPCTGVPSFNTQLRRPVYIVASTELGGHHVLSTTWYAWNLSVARSSQTGQVGDRNASFAATQLTTSNCQYSPQTTKNLYQPQWSPACFTETYNPSNFTLSDLSTSGGLTAQLNLQAGGTMGKNYHIGSHLATIEVGGKFRNAHKFDDTFVDDRTPTSSISLAMFPSTFSNPNYYQGAYKLGPNPSFQEIFAFANAHPSDFSVDPSTSHGANYDLIEKVSAGYIMNTVDFANVRIIAGVRFEGTNLDTRVPQVDPNGDLIPNASPILSNGSYVKVLPSASVRIALTSDTNLRFVYSRGLARPDYADLAQPLVIDQTASPIAVSVGNPNLKPELADNIDVLGEHYLKGFGMISVGFFYKHLSDPLVPSECTGTVSSCPFPTSTTGGFNPTDNVQVTEEFNGGSAWLTGFEFAYLQHLTFLPGGLRGLGISANYGYTASSTDLGPNFNRTDHPRLLRDAPNTWNISPTYDMGRVSLRLGLSYNGPNIAAYQFATGAAGGIKGPFGDNYFYAHLQVDAQGSVRLNHGLTFIMYGLNLNNEVFGFYNGSPQYMVQREYYRPSIAAGFRWTPFGEK